MSEFPPPFQLTDLPALNLVTVPDLWQQQAVAALRDGQDVVVQAPTGSGKTLIFELWSTQGKNRGQAIYTVPTRALANDKLAEWRARGWDVGIATGDLAENLGAPVLVATLETQKNRLIQGDGPSLLVVDEYQMIGDLDRGLNYELALALAPGTPRRPCPPRSSPGPARGSPRQQPQLSCPGRNPRLLAPAGRQSPRRGPRPHPHLRPPPPGRRIDGQ